MIEVYSLAGMDKKGKWSSPKIVLTVDKEARTVTVPGKVCKRATVVVERVRLSIG